MKYLIKIFPLLLLITVVASCKKQLDRNPTQSVDASVALKSATDVESAVVGTYSIMAGGALYGTNLFMLADLQASEDYATWTGTFQSFDEVSSKEMSRDNAEASRTWIAGYRAINMANIVLNSLNVVTDLTKKTQLEGEALFIRGIMHFEVLRYYALPWGATPANDHMGIVIKTKPAANKTQATEKLPRSTTAQVYQQILSDLKAAIEKLPEDNGVRANKFTALAFLARVYLQQNEYASALDAANQVINSEKYKMNTSVIAVFDNKNTAESLWEIQQNDQNNAGTSNDGMATFYGNLPGIGRADFPIEQTWIESYDVNDMRRKLWYYEGTGASTGDWGCGKWKSFSQNLPVIRIAEMYLIRAESNLRLSSAVGDTPENDLAKIRNPLRTGLAVISNPSLNDLISERFKELAFEGARIHDFKRLHLSTGSFAWNAPELVFPIPQREIDATEGVLKQNQGY